MSVYTKNPGSSRAENELSNLSSVSGEMSGHIGTLNLLNKN